MSWFACLQPPRGVCGDGSRLEEAFGAIEESKVHRTRSVAFTDSLSLLMALNVWSVVVGDAVLRRIWDLILRIVRSHTSVNFQFSFSHYGARDEAEEKGVEYGIAKEQSRPCSIADTTTGVERQGGNEVYRVFEDSRIPRTYRSALLDRVRPAPKRPKADHLGEPCSAQFGTGTSKHFGWPDGVLTRQTDQLE
ncbi:hypothetical protein TRVL_09628 [Trypanosoma vivax]|nr:hypothetical protein TRVL_09628 [Trypanosoma vivax]